MQREIVLDTETTGLDPKTGDRLVEIGCIEIINRVPTGIEFHRFINPEREVPAEAHAVHGLSTAFLKDKPCFHAVVEDFVAFIGNDPLVIHNANFDIAFLNHELGRLKRPPISMVRVVDTLALARRKHPAGPNSLDALCKRYGIDNTKRIKHGALMDSVLLAKVYLELLGERQAAFGLGAPTAGQARTPGGVAIAVKVRTRPQPLPSRLTQADLERHAAYIAALGEKAIWNRYQDAAALG